MQHSSLQYSDPKKQQQADIRDLFRQGSNFPIKTGTEAGLSRNGGNMNRRYLQMNSERYNHEIAFNGDVWVAVDKKIIVPRSVRKAKVPLAKGVKRVGMGHDPCLASMTFDHVDRKIGTVSVACTHYPTKGRLPRDPNHDVNKAAAQDINDWFEKNSSGDKLAFLNGDFNMNDAKQDWSFGEDFLSLGDELKEYPNSGHGPIDGFMSYNKDKRVSGKAIYSLDDRQMFQFSDHWVVRGVWEIADLKEGTKK